MVALLSAIPFNGILSLNTDFLEYVLPILYYKVFSTQAPI
jgi:hypothetical protein